MHRKYVKYLLLILLLLISSNSFGQTTPNYSNVDIIIIRNMYIESFSYPFTFTGARYYLDDVEFDKPDLFDKLDPLVSDMEFQSGMALGGGIGVGAIGAGLIACGFIFPEPTQGFEDWDPPVTHPNYLFLIPGLVLLGSGLPIAMFLQPGENEMHRFVNRHNKLNEEDKIEVR